VLQAEHCDPRLEIERPVILRAARPDDAAACGRVCYEAFRVIAERHGFPPDFPSPEAATAVVGHLLAHPRVHGVVAEGDGRVLGSNFVDERGPIAGVGPITVDPALQDRAVGRRLMEYVIRRSDERGAPGVRLVQAGYHARSLSLYAKLGFVAREPLATMQGRPPAVDVPGRTVRTATDADLDACDALCRRVHGHDRSGELRDAIAQGTATVVEHGGRITGYATTVGFFGHAVCGTDDDVKALVAAAPAFPGPGFLLPIRNAELFRWCLAHGLRVVHTMTLMSRGLYHEPAGAFLPSVAF
jgi:predicted N-acetyltransferase YhbS